MTEIRDDLKYTKEHEWIKIEGNVATEGITDYAQSELSDIVMIELPEVGKEVKAGDAIGTIEAVKAVSDLYAGLSGKVIEVNQDAVADPSILNKDPYEKGWLYRIEIKDTDEVANLLSAEEYKKLITEH